MNLSIILTKVGIILEWLLLKSRTVYFSMQVPTTLCISGFSNSTQVLILNLHIGLNLTPSRNLQVYLSLKDLLNQNQGIFQNYQQNVFEQSSSQTLGRYGMIGLKYALGQKNNQNKLFPSGR